MTIQFSTTSSASLGLALFLTTLACGPQPATTVEGGESGETSTSADTETTDTETGETGPEPDLPAAPFMCDPWAQDCPVGEKCVPHERTGGAWSGTLCVPVTGTQQAGQACAYGGDDQPTDDCDATSFCWNIDWLAEPLVGECVSFCTGSPDAAECPPGFECVQGREPEVIPCLDRCDPLVQDCPADEGCFWAGLAFQCDPDQGTPTGEPCLTNECAAGNVCTATGRLPSCDGVHCCTAICDLGLGDIGCEAQPGTSCLPFFGAGGAPAGDEDVGHCVLP